MQIEKNGQMPKETTSPAKYIRIIKNFHQMMDV
jgi:uncharacterized protein YjiS (DUF1127 family)